MMMSLRPQNLFTISLGPRPTLVFMMLSQNFAPMAGDDDVSETAENVLDFAVTMEHLSDFVPNREAALSFLMGTNVYI